MYIHVYTCAHVVGVMSRIVIRCPSCTWDILGGEDIPGWSCHQVLVVPGCLGWSLHCSRPKSQVLVILGCLVSPPSLTPLYMKP